MTVAVPKADLYAKLDAWLEENEPIKLHKPGGKGHNQKRHGARAKSGASALTQAEQDEQIKNFTEDSYLQRERIASGNPSDSDKALLQALESRPAYEGTMYRGMVFGRNETDKFDGFMNMARGGEIQNSTITSFTTDRKVMQRFSLNNERAPAQEPTVHMTVKSRTGRSISNVSYNPGEKEVVSLPNTRYRVTKISEKKLNVHTIEMTEIE